MNTIDNNSSQLSLQELQQRKHALETKRNKWIGILLAIIFVPIALEFILENFLAEDTVTRLIGITYMFLLLFMGYLVVKFTKLTWENRKLTATFTGTEDGITAKLESEVETSVPYDTVYKRPTKDNPEGKIVGGDPGKTIRVWKKVYQDDKLVEKKKLSYDKYQPLTKTIYTANPPEEDVSE